jgi:Mg2+/citrate symporter
MLLICIRIKQTFLLFCFDLILNLAESERKRENKERASEQRASEQKANEQKSERTTETSE